jgi:hypothetical protein
MRYTSRYAVALSLVFVASRVAVAQDVPSRESALEIRKQFLADLDTLHSKFVALAEAIPAEKYAWRPAEGVRSIGEAFMHAASEFYVFTPLAYGGTPSPVIPRGQGSMKTFESKSTKPDVLKHLNEGFAYTKQTLTAIDPAAITGTKKLFGGDHTIVETSFIMSGDLHEHLGQLIAYARANGVKPPWSK